MRGPISADAFATVNVTCHEPPPPHPNPILRKLMGNKTAKEGVEGLQRVVGEEGWWHGIILA